MEYVKLCMSIRSGTPAIRHDSAQGRLVRAWRGSPGSAVSLGLGLLSLRDGVVLRRDAGRNAPAIADWDALLLGPGPDATAALAS